MNIEKLVSLLESSKADTRFDACELLRVAPQITDEAIAALEKALDDPDQYVRYSAKSALRVHKLSSDKQCPNCGLWNTEIAQRCNCGYSYSTGLIMEMPWEKTHSMEKSDFYYAMIGLAVSIPLGFMVGLIFMEINESAEIFSICYLFYALFVAIFLGPTLGLFIGEILERRRRQG